MHNGLEHSQSHEFVATPTSPLSSSPVYSPTLTNLVAFTEQVVLAFQQASQAACLPVEYFYRIGDRVVQLCFTNSDMAALLTPALAHLAVLPVPTPALTVYLWDSVSTGVTLPAMPTELQRATEQPSLQGVHVHAAAIHAFWQPAHQVLSLFDKSRKLAVYWTQDAHHLPIYEGGAPLRLILHWWLSQQRQQVVHAAAVGTTAGAALLVGQGGSGKSNTALRCLHDGLLYIGDDYCLLGTDERPTVYSLYSSAKLYTADAAHFPRLQAALTTASYAYPHKQLYFLHELFSSQIVQCLPLRAVLLPKITAMRDTRLIATSAAQALVAVAPSTTLQLPGVQPQTIQQISTVLRRVPSYWLELGTDLAQIPGVIKRLLDGLSEENR